MASLDDDLIATLQALPVLPASFSSPAHVILEAELRDVIVAKLQLAQRQRKVPRETKR